MRKMGLSRLCAKCRQCRFTDTCNHKEMEALAYIGEELSRSPCTQIHQPLLSLPKTTVTPVISTGIFTSHHGNISVDKKLLEDEINKALHKDLFMPLC